MRAVVWSYQLESCKGMNFATLPYPTRVVPLPDPTLPYPTVRELYPILPYPTLSRSYSSPTLRHNVRTLYPTLPYPNKLKSHNNRILCMISLFSYELMKLNTADI